MRAATHRLEQMGITWEAFNDEAAPGSSSSTWRRPTRDRGRLDRAGEAGRARGGLRARPCRHLHGQAVPRASATGCTCTCPFGVTASVFDRDDDVLRHWVGGALATLGGDIDPGADDQLVPPAGRLRRRADHPDLGRGQPGRGADGPAGGGGAAPSTAWPRGTPTPTWCWPRSWPAGSPGWRSASTRPIPSPTFPGGHPTTTPAPGVDHRRRRRAGGRRTAGQGARGPVRRALDRDSPVGVADVPQRGGRPGCS